MVAFGKDYFEGNGYSRKERVIKRHVFEALKWASPIVGEDLLNGRRKTALDVGCACGYTSAVLEGLGYETVSVDVSNWGLKKAKDVTRGDLLMCDAQVGLPFKSKSFDVVACFDVLEHLENPERAFQWMLEACRGTLVCTTPNKAVEKAIRRFTGDYDETHISTRKASEWDRLVKNAVHPNLCKVESFLDLTGNFAGKRFFFRSLRIPKFGLTVRIAASANHPAPPSI
jgi:2-polyprenyl-3-methyl-5-hydroxy-6-metoxy-1,4-benzoquinol methylase